MAEGSTEKTNTGVAAQGESSLTREYALPPQAMTLLGIALIAATTFWIYFPAIHGAFLWDDIMYITGNPYLDKPGFVWKAWFQPIISIDYYPLKDTVLWLQWQLWRDDTLGYHLTNVFLHIVNALLVWRLLAKFRLRLAWVGGLLFALHPMNVESVAWITELKNTLSTVPFLLAMCAWIDYDERRDRRHYFLALGLFLAAMLCKVTMATFPLVLLLYAWWKRGRIGWSDLRVSVPFFAVSFVLGLVAHTMEGRFEELYHIVPPPLGGFVSRLGLVGNSIQFYLGRFFWPVDPTPMYPQWPVNPPSLLQFLPWLVLAAVLAWLWSHRAGWGRHALLGLGYFLILALPFLGMRNIAFFSYSWVMDHIFYLPMIGLIGLVVAAAGDIDERLPRAAHPVTTGLLVIALVLMAFESHAYAAAFTDGETLWTHAVEENPDAWLGYDYLGKHLLIDKRPADALGQFRKSEGLRPDFADAHAGMGAALLALGRVPEAITEYRASLAISPDYPAVQNNLGIVLAQTGQTADALACFQTAIKDDPRYADAYLNMGNTYFISNRFADAANCYASAVKLQPTSINAHNNLGVTLARLGQLDGAREQFQQVLQLDPANATARSSLEQLQQAASAPK